jgi:hypothetical protein
MILGEPAMVAQACNPSFWGDRDRKDHRLKSSQTKVLQTPSQPMVGCSGLGLSSQLCGEAEIRGSMVQASWA